MRRRISAFLIFLIVISILQSGCRTEKAIEQEYEISKGEVRTPQVQLSLLWIGDNSTEGIEAVCKASEKKLGIKIEIENMGGGEDADAIVKTRLASGNMADMICYNPGSLLAALNPDEYFANLTDEAFAHRIDENFKAAASVNGILYGIPSESTQVGAILYNKDIYEKYNLSIPKTWDEFRKNCDRIKAGGEAAVLGAFADSWTAQIPYLGDHYNVDAANPQFAEQFQSGLINYTTDMTGFRSFEKMYDLTAYYNEDYLTTSYETACEYLVNGTGAHWFILSSALGNIYDDYGERVNTIGCFAIPGDDPNDNGLTVWQPNGIYANLNSAYIDEIKTFFEFYISDEGLDIYTEVLLPAGPYCINGYHLPADCYEAVTEMQAAYFNSGRICDALEFQSIVKGPACATICQELGAGYISVKEATERYDEDCRKQARQLGLSWGK